MLMLQSILALGMNKLSSLTILREVAHILLPLTVLIRMERVLKFSINASEMVVKLQPQEKPFQKTVQMQNLKLNLLKLLILELNIGLLDWVKIMNMQ